jgi:hypothetical protein
MNPEGLVLAAIGIFAICGAALNWSFFMNNRKARFIVAILGHAGARAFYVLLGGGLVTCGLMMALGVWTSAK